MIEADDAKTAICRSGLTVCRKSASTPDRRDVKMSDIKLQIGCIAILLFLLAIYLFKLFHYKRKIRFSPFSFFSGWALLR